MRTFYCSNCKHRVFFENVQCTNCQSTLAFLPDQGTISALKPTADGVFVPVAPGKHPRSYRLCQNMIDHAACSWAVPADTKQPFCRSCRLNETIPDLSQPGAKDAWIRLERSKRWLLCNLMRLGLHVPARLDPEGHKMRFAFLADTKTQKAFTGQADGLITININEADDPFREKIRHQLGETYRTVLGHFRHEIGHYYWDQLIQGGPHLEAFRELFGNDTQDYQASLERHYKEGPPSDWPTHFVSSYASMHPWEDWAETWAHYLHLVDTLETARFVDLVLKVKVERGSKSESVDAAEIDFTDFEDMLRSWVPFTIALNSLNRSMGLMDAYPFVLSESAIDKLRFVHRVVQASKGSPDEA
jgi:hypothetical protein